MNVGASTLAARIVVRTGAQIWRNKLTWLAAGATATLLTVFQLGGAFASVAMPGVASPASASSDCADTVMQMLVNQTPAAAHAAYRCLSGTTTQALSEEQFVQQAQNGGMPSVRRLSRVGQRPLPDGGTVVYFALDRNDGTLVYSVFQGPDGRVLHIE